MDDKTLKDKLSSLDTLSGGIVYGREEAWDKLQAKLEQKPAKKIILRIPLAAAATLLLMLSVIAWQYNAGTQTVTKRSEVATAINKKIQPVAETRKNSLPVDAPSVTKKTNNKSATPVIKHTVLSTTIPQPAAQTLPVEQIVVATRKDTAMTPPAPVNLAMKTVHINDVENYTDRETSSPSVAASPKQVTIEEMPVYHINDVEKHQTDFTKMYRESRATIGLRSIFRPGQNNYYPTTEEYYQPRNLLKNLLNTQN
jgi:hypothetical protein